MGLFKKIGKSFSKGFKAVGKATKNVFKSNIFKVATSALSFVPGLNAAGLIGKGLSVLGKASNIKNWIGAGLGAFQKLSKGFRLGDAVKGLISGRSNPLGGLSNLIGGSLNPLKRASDFLKLLQPKASAFQDLLGFSKQLQKMTGKLPIPGLPLPQVWPQISKELGAFTGLGGNYIHRLEDFGSRMQGVSGMLQELLRHLGSQTVGGTAQIIRA